MQWNIPNTVIKTFNAQNKYKNYVIITINMLLKHINHLYLNNGFLLNNNKNRIFGSIFSVWFDPLN